VLTLRRAFSVVPVEAWIEVLNSFEFNGRAVPPGSELSVIKPMVLTPKFVDSITISCGSALSYCYSKGCRLPGLRRPGSGTKW